MTKNYLPFQILTAAVLFGVGCLSGANAQTLGSDFAGSYSVRDLGVAGDVPVAYGAMIFKSGDSNSLLVAGSAASVTAGIYEIKVTRDAQNHITGFAATAAYFADAPGIPPRPAYPLDVEGGIDGGLDYGPNGVFFYTSYHDDAISQIKPGSTSPSKQDRMIDLGINGAGGGGLLFVPAGFPGAGRLKAASSGWFDATVTADGAGTFNIATNGAPLDFITYAQGLAYVKAGKPGFAKDSVVIAGDDRVIVYEINANGDPVEGTLRELLTDFYLAKGATVDPVTGDFLFATGDFNSPRILLIGNLSVGQTQVRITSPPGGSAFTGPAAFLFNAEATQPGGSIARVDFYVGASLLASVTHPPFSALADNLPAAAYTLTAVAFDGGGNATTSAPVGISVVNYGPRVTLDQPVRNAVLPACSDLTLVAQIQTGNGAIVSVEFFDGATSLGVSHEPFNYQPYTWKVLDLAEGTRTFSVMITDYNGLSSVAVATNVVVQPLQPNKLVIHHYVPSQLKFCFKGVPGSNYVWESSASLLLPQWAPFLTNTATAERLQVTNQLNIPPRTGFYRTRRAN